MSHISFYPKLLGQRSARKSHAALDVAGAGNVPLVTRQFPTLRTWRGLETCFLFRLRASPRPYLREASGEIPLAYSPRDGMGGHVTCITNQLV